jgi:DNA-binding MarR family transcriptional regulator
VEPDHFVPATRPYDADERELLEAVRELVRADREMRRVVSRRMEMGETDLRAVRFVMAAHRDRPATPHEVADHLGISTAATTVLLDRLVDAGHVQRSPHPTDRRSKVITPTPHAYEETYAALAAAHDRMRTAAAAVPATARPAVLDFLRALTEAMRGEATPESG